jgi:hypothetical protein
MAIARRAYLRELNALADTSLLHGSDMAERTLLGRPMRKIALAAMHGPQNPKPLSL